MSTTSSTNSVVTPSAAPPNPRVGVSVFILRPGSSSSPSFIMGQRLGSHGAGTYALPGGHIEFGESIETTAAREVLEETGLHIHDVRYLTATNDVFVREGKHYITLFVTAEVVPEDAGREPQVLEPNKCAGWSWMDWEEMRALVLDGKAGQGKELFLPMINLIKQRPGVVPTRS